MLGTSLGELAWLGGGVFALMALSGGLCVLLGRIVIPRLVKMKINDGENRKASEYLAMLHGTKKNTPTMGGIFVVPAILTSVGAAVFLISWRGTAPVVDGPIREILNLAGMSLFVLVSNAALGFIDDYRKLKKLGKDGLSGKTKLAAQTLIAAGACAVGVDTLGPDFFVIHLPFITLTLGWWAVPLGTFVMVGAGNAFNLTDGLDGLAGGTGAVSFFALGGGALMLTLFGTVSFPVIATSLVAFAASGALIGFLFWNRHPARVFMGDTGSLSLGALMGFIAVMSGLELILAVAGGVFVVEALSVMLQVGYFKATKGKRIFKCAPLHHHFQFSGWHETKVTKHFIGAAIACAMIALALSATMIRPAATKVEPTATVERRVPENAVVENRSPG